MQRRKLQSEEVVKLTDRRASTHTQVCWPGLVGVAWVECGVTVMHASGGAQK